MERKLSRRINTTAEDIRRGMLLNHMEDIYEMVFKYTLKTI